MVTEETKFIKHIFNYNVGEVERLVKWIGLEDDFKDVKQTGLMQLPINYSNTFFCPFKGMAREYE